MVMARAKKDPPDPEDAFVEGLLARGEAAEPVEGEVPPGATHEVVEADEGDEGDEGDAEPAKPPKVRRKRFSAY